MSVVIVGAGLAGLAATHKLRKNGVQVTTFESKNLPGGRVGCYRKEGYCFDIGAQFGVRRYTHLISLCNELGLGHELQSIPFQGSIWRDGRAHYLHGWGGIPYLLKSMPQNLRFRGLPHEAYRQFGKLALAVAKRLRGLNYDSYDFSGLYDLQGMTAEEFTQRHGGQEALDYVVWTAVGTLILSEPADISAALLIGLIKAASGVRMLERGMGSFTEALYERHKDNIRLSTPVKEIVIEDKKIKGVQTEDGFLDAEHVICATTAGVALNITPGLPDTLKKPLETVGYSSTSHFMFALEERLFPEDWYVIALPRDTGSLFPAIFDFSAKSRYFAPPGTGLVHCMTFGNRDTELSKLSHKELRRAVLREIQRFLPTMPDEPFMTEFIRWNEAVCLQAPGQIAGIDEMNRYHVNDVKGLHLAGSYLTPVSCMESAVRSGEEAAAAVLRS